MFDADWRSKFQQSPYRLRFELGGEVYSNVTEPVPRFLQAIDRAHALADAAFAGVDRCYAYVSGTVGTGIDVIHTIGFPGKPVIAKLEWCTIFE